MKNYVIAAVILAVGSTSLQAKQLTKEQLPEKIRTHFAKKHPKVTNLVITEEKHFGQALYELDFIEELTIKVPDEKDVKGQKLKAEVAKEETAVFYRTNGHFFVNSEKIYAFNIIPGVVINGLKAAFPEYKMTAAQLIPNPNGPGEEYEVVITAAGGTWRVSIDSKGGIISKENVPAVPAATAPAAPAKPAASAAPAKK